MKKNQIIAITVLSVFISFGTIAFAQNGQRGEMRERPGMGTGERPRMGTGERPGMLSGNNPIFAKGDTLKVDTGFREKVKILSGEKLSLFKVLRRKVFGIK